VDGYSGNSSLLDMDDLMNAAATDPNSKDAPTRKGLLTHIMVESVEYQEILNYNKKNQNQISKSKAHRDAMQAESKTQDFKRINVGILWGDFNFKVDGGVVTWYEWDFIVDPDLQEVIGYSIKKVDRVLFDKDGLPQENAYRNALSAAGFDPDTLKY
jgi:Cu2+-containing amine oxidase